jgi:hypothetical protein
MIKKMGSAVAAIGVVLACLLSSSCTSVANPSGTDDIYDDSYAGGSSDLESVKVEYNADLARLQSLLDEASSYESQIRRMEPVDQYSASAVNEYNRLVDSYNAVADRYRGAATAFNDKYKSYASGANGNVPTSPDNITLPDPIP